MNIEYSLEDNVDDNMKQIYDMIDGIPIWQHLKNGSDENKIRLIATDFGKFAEILGRRVINKLTEKGGISRHIIGWRFCCRYWGNVRYLLYRIYERNYM